MSVSLAIKLEMHFDFPFNLIGKLTIVQLLFFDRPIVACTQIFVNIWGPEQGFLHWLADKLDQRFTGNSGCGAGYEFV